MTLLKAHWFFLKCLFSTPVWLTLNRITTTIRSWGERNHAFVGESGMINLDVESPLKDSSATDGIACTDQNAAEVIRVRMPVMTISHCQGSKCGVLMWRHPKLIKPEIICAVNEYFCCRISRGLTATHKFHSSVLEWISCVSNYKRTTNGRHPNTNIRHAKFVLSECKTWTSGSWIYHFQHHRAILSLDKVIYPAVMHLCIMIRTR